MHAEACDLTSYKPPTYKLFDLNKVKSLLPSGGRGGGVGVVIGTLGSHILTWSPFAPPSSGAAVLPPQRLARSLAPVSGLRRGCPHVQTNRHRER